MHFRDICSPGIIFKELCQPNSPESGKFDTYLGVYLFVKSRINICFHSLRTALWNARYPGYSEFAVLVDNSL